MLLFMILVIAKFISNRVPSSEVRKELIKMKFDLDDEDFTFQDEAIFMDLNRQMESRQQTFKSNNNNNTLGFNNDTIYNKIEQ